jgi:hypothetical protein
LIDVHKKTDNEFNVIVEYKGVKTEHNVTLNDEYHQKLTNGKITKEELIKRSFEFLLKRESNQSILRSFDLPVINRYFPEYESQIAE